jgi:hypothetical protein
MQEAILLFFQRIAFPLLDQAAEIITMMGEDVIVISLMVVIFLAVDKKKGFVISIDLLASMLCMSTLKAIVRQPRPFLVIEGLDAKRVETATGYSFPSGHTTTSSSFYSAIAYNFRKKGLSIVCAILILLIGLSRMYLGVHWPLDVVCGWILGITITFALNDLLMKLFENERTMMLFTVISGSVTAIGGLIMSSLVTASLIDATAFSDFSKLLGISCGALFGFALEERFGRFSVDGIFREKFFRTIIGLLSMIFIRSGLKALFPENVFFDWLRYVILGIWTFGLYPIIGLKIKLFRPEIPQKTGSSNS